MVCGANILVVCEETMAKDLVLECIKSYKTHLHLALENLTKLFTDERISKNISQDMQSRAASMYLLLIDVGRIASLSNSEHLKLLSYNVKEFLKTIPQEELTAAEFADVLETLGPDHIIKLELGNC